MGCGEENLFSKRFLPHKTVLQYPPFFVYLTGWKNILKILFFQHILYGVIG